MKLKDWADKQGISYITAYRWFKNGKLPVHAYQSDSGTIIVQDDSENSEQSNMPSNTHSTDLMSIFLKKTVEFSKNNASIEDFAAFVLSNFSLKPLNTSDSPKYSKNKPKTEDIQKHFQQFLPNKTSIDHLKMIKTLIKDKIPANTLSEDEARQLRVEAVVNPDIFADSLINSFEELESTSVDSMLVKTAGTVSSSVNLTPQNNYTGSTSCTLGFSSSNVVNDLQTAINSCDAYVSAYPYNDQVVAGYTAEVTTFKPTQKELESFSNLTPSPLRKRGRPAKK